MTPDVEPQEHVGNGALLLETDSRDGDLREVSIRLPRDLLEQADDEGRVRFKPTRSAPWVTLVVEGEADLWDETRGDDL